MVSKNLEMVVAPTCASHAGDTIPCGACCDEGAMCEAGRTRECPGVPLSDPSFPFSPYDEWLCVCTAGMWDCEVKSPAAASCPPPLGDAGAGD